MHTTKLRSLSKSSQIQKSLVNSHVIKPNFSDGNNFLKAKFHHHLARKVVVIFHQIYTEG